jgi:protein TonB
MSTPLLFNNLLAYSLQVGFLVALSAVGLAAVRVKAPRARLLYWHLVLAASLLLPLVQPWRHAVAGGSAQIVTTAVMAVARSAPRRVVSWNEIALLLIAAGILLHLGKLALGFWHLRRYRRRSRPLDVAGDFAGFVTVIGEAEFRLSGEVTSPVTFGFIDPVILLPNAFPSLYAPLQEAIIRHEVLHVERRDWLFTVAEELVRAAFWFHPAIWWLLSEVQLEREQAVDELVVEATQAREQYVDALLAIAGTQGHSDVGLDLAPAPLFLRKRHLKQRVVSILNEIRMSRTRMICGLGAGVTVLAASAWFVTVVFPLEGAPQTPPDAVGVTVEINGAKMLHRTGVNYPADAIAKGIQGTVVVQAKLDAQGNVVDASVMSGPDELRKSALQSVLGWHFAQEGAAGTRLVSVLYELPKSTAAVASVNVAGQPGVIAGGRGGPVRVVGGLGPAGAENQTRVVRGITVSGLSDEARASLLAKLPVHEGDALTPDLAREVSAAATAFDAHLRVIQAMSPADQSVQLFVSPADSGQREFLTGAPPPPPPPPAPGIAQGVRVGAEVQQANLLSQPKTVYPALAKAARVQGAVTFQTLIDKEGHVQQIQLVSGPPLLVEAAKNAVSQWVYRPTLLNGAPTEVTTTVTVNFTLTE